jgi:hypothetical protein
MRFLLPAYPTRVNCMWKALPLCVHEEVRMYPGIHGCIPVMSRDDFDTINHLP